MKPTLYINDFIFVAGNKDMISDEPIPLSLLNGMIVPFYKISPVYYCDEIELPNEFKNYSLFKMGESESNFIIIALHSLFNNSRITQSTKLRAELQDKIFPLDCDLHVNFIEKDEIMNKIINDVHNYVEVVNMDKNMKQVQRYLAN